MVWFGYEFAQFRFGMVWRVGLANLPLKYEEKKSQFIPKGSTIRLKKYAIFFAICAFLSFKQTKDECLGNLQ